MVQNGNSLHVKNESYSSKLQAWWVLAKALYSVYDLKLAVDINTISLSLSMRTGSRGSR